MDFVGFKPEPEPGGQQTLMSQAKSDAVQTLSEQEPVDDSLPDEVTGTTTNCPTESSNPKEVPTTTIVSTTTAGEGQLPFTGSNAAPILIAGLVLVVGGAAALLASRMRSRQAK